MKVDIRLNDMSIAEAIAKVKRFQKKYEPNNVAFFVSKLVSVGEGATEGRLSATDALSGETYDADISTQVSTSGSQVTGTIVLGGDWPTFVEFGVGITHNGLPSSHPAVTGGGNLNGDSFPADSYGIGSYGDHHGLEESWSFIGEDGHKHKAEGFAAQMPLYNAAEAIRGEFLTVAKEVFTNGSV